MIFRSFDEEFIKAAADPFNRKKAIETYSIARTFTFIFGIISMGVAFFWERNESIGYISGLILILISVIFDYNIKMLKICDNFFQDTKIKRKKF